MEPHLFVKTDKEVQKGTRICEWDPYNAVIIAELDGKISFSDVIDGVTYKEESDEQTGFSEKVIIETRDRTKNPEIMLLNELGEAVKTYNLPVKAHITC